MIAWPERVTIILAMGIGAVVFMFGAMLNANATSADWLVASAEIWWHLCKMTAFPLWFVLRLIAFASGRRAHS
jgi:hypothetical protein